MISVTKDNSSNLTNNDLNKKNSNNNIYSNLNDQNSKF